MKLITKTILKINEQENLADSVNGTIHYTNGVVAQLENKVVQLSGMQHSPNKIAEIKQRVNEYNAQEQTRHKIPAHAYEGFVKEKRKKMFVEILLIASEAFLTYYAMKLMIARGDNSLWWTFIRYAIAILATVISVLAAEEFFKKYFIDEKIKLKIKYAIQDGNDAAPVLEKDKKAISEAAIWFVLMVMANMVVLFFAIIRSKGVEATNDWVQTAGLVLLSAVLPIIGGMLYANIDRISYVIRAYRKQALVIKQAKQIDRELGRIPMVQSNKYKAVIHKECSKAYKRINMFEAMLNQNNAKQHLPKASRQGIEFIATFSTFLAHIQQETNSSMQSAIAIASKSMMDNFDMMPSTASLMTQSIQPEHEIRPAPASQPTPPERVIPEPPFNTIKPNGSRISFDKN